MCYHYIIEPNLYCPMSVAHCGCNCWYRYLNRKVYFQTTTQIYRVRRGEDVNRSTVIYIEVDIHDIKRVEIPVAHLSSRGNLAPCQAFWLCIKMHISNFEVLVGHDTAKHMMHMISSTGIHSGIPTPPISNSRLYAPYRRLSSHMKGGDVHGSTERFQPGLQCTIL